MGLHDRNFEAASSEPAMETATLIHAGEIVRQLLVYLKANPIAGDRILDSGDLPLPKSSLINAFRLLIASEPRFEQRAQLQRVGLLLAQFQTSSEPQEETKAADGADDPLVAWIDTLADETGSKTSPWLAVYREQERLGELFEISARMAERRNPLGAADTDARQADRLTH